ncbi:MAG: transporter, family, multidrug resistance protein [Clostridia bacterium]|nr:drug resistance transporter, Bcr/CflA subfamily [Clostridiales bacterium]MDK2986088.1 transporter, family, multidrug resistance protein [Clostridia bacterium]
MENCAKNSAAVQLSTRVNCLQLSLILGGLTALGPLSIDMYLPALPGLAKGLNTSASSAQLSLTFFLLGLAIGQLFAGPLSDIRGRRKPLLVGLTIYIVSSLLCALSPSIWLLIVLRFLQGLAGAAGVVISRAIVRDLYSGSELTKFISRLMLVNGAAPVLAPIAGGQLLRVTSWHGVFIVLAVIGIILLLTVFFGVSETLPAQSRSEAGINNTLSILRNLINDRIFMGYALSQGLVSAAMFAYISGSPFVLQEIFSISPQIFSLLFAINSFGIIIASQVTGRLAGRINETKLFVTGIGISFIGSSMLLTAIIMEAGLFLILLPLFFAVSSVGIVMTTGFSLAMQNQGQTAGSASAVLGVLSFIFGAFAAPLVGLGGSQTALPLGVVIAAVSFGSVLSYTILVRRKL